MIKFISRNAHYDDNHTHTLEHYQYKMSKLGIFSSSKKKARFKRMKISNVIYKTQMALASTL